MAKFNAEVPNEIIKQFEDLSSNCEQMLGEMTKAGAEVVYNKVKANMRKSFKDTSRLENNLKITRTYKTRSDDGINTKVGIYGYLSGTEGNAFKTSKGKGKKYTYNNGVPAPFVAIQREYGNSRGERKKPFMRPAFQKNDIEKAMLEVQKKYIKDE